MTADIPVLHKLQPRNLRGTFCAIAIVYHYCHPADQAPFPGLRGVAPDEFGDQLDQLSRFFEITTLAKLLDPSTRPRRPAAVVTFDDGLKDVSEHVAPILNRKGIPITVYCSTLPLIERTILPVHRIHLLQATLGIARFQEEFEREIRNYPTPFRLDSPEALGIRSLYPYDDSVVRKFKQRLNYELPYAPLDTVLTAISHRHLPDDETIHSDLYANIDGLQALAEEGHEIGLHTHTHTILSRLSRAEQLHELQTSFDFLQARTNTSGPSFAYPYGGSGTWNDATVDLLQELGYSGAVTTLKGIITPDILDHRWTIPRLDVRDVFDEDNRVRKEILDSICA